MKVTGRPAEECAEPLATMKHEVNVMVRKSQAKNLRTPANHLGRDGLPHLAVGTSTPGRGEASTPRPGCLSTLAATRRTPSTGYLRFLLGVGGGACASP